MPAKLDINKPLRLIGVQVFEGTLKSVRKTLTPGWYPFIRCKQDIGTSCDVYPEVAEDVCPQDYYRISDDLPRISVSAVAGKNGSGKSTLLDIMYRIINNFTENTFLMKGVDETDEIGHAYGIKGRLHFEQDGVQKFIECNDSGTDYYEVVNGVKERIEIHGLTEIQRSDILNGFFYTISVNYSLYAFNPADSQTPFKTDHVEDDGSWMQFLFHKNDGYYKPIVLTPFRDKGQIDVNNENLLAKQRIEVLSLLFHSQGKEFLDDYVPETLQYKFNKDYKNDKELLLQEKPICVEIRKSTDVLIKKIERLWLDYLKNDLKIEDLGGKNREEIVLYYLAYKTLKICKNYPLYNQMSGFDDLVALAEPQWNKDSDGTVLPETDGQGNQIFLVSDTNAEKWFIEHQKVIEDVIKEIDRNTDSHITVKVQQCLDYLKEKRYQKEADKLEVTKALLKGKRYETYDEMMKLLPPAFFLTEVTYKKKGKIVSDEDDDKMTLQTMSSGERQMLYSLSYIYYHIKNIASIKENGKRVVGYHHINLIFDEAELYYHPEYQRQFLKRLLERLAYCHINKTNIRSINIMIITHSPFILSDLPKSNILFLKKGDEDEDRVEKETLGSNIYDLLKSGFFLDYAIGDLVQQKLQDILDCYYEKKDEMRKKTFEKNKAEYQYTISHLGEDYLKRSFQNLYDQMEVTYNPLSRRMLMEQQVRYHQEQARLLTEKLKEG